MRDFNFFSFILIKIFSNNKTPIYSIGDPGDLTYKYNIVGKTTQDLKDIIEKPSYDFLINTGLYVMNKKILKYIPKNLKSHDYKKTSYGGVDYGIFKKRFDFLKNINLIKGSIPDTLNQVKQNSRNTLCFLNV